MRIKIFSILVNTSIYLAVAAVCAVNCFGVFYDSIPTEVNLLVFFATVLVYNSHQIGKFTFGGYVPNSVKYNWVKNHLSILKFLVLLSGLVLCYLAINCPREIWFYLSWAAIVALLYPAKVIPFKGSLIAPRDLPHSKAILVALVWTYVTTVVPGLFVEHKLLWEQPTFWLFVFGRFCWFYIITGISDIRDVETDNNSLKTLPQSIGLKKTKIVFSLLLVFIALSGLVCYLFGLMSLTIMLALWLSHAVLTILVWLASPQQKNWYFTLLVDGMLILQFALVWLVS